MNVVDAWNKAYPEAPITEADVLGTRDYEGGVTRAVFGNGNKVQLDADGTLTILTGPGAIAEPPEVEAPTSAASEEAAELPPAPIAEDAPAPAPAGQDENPTDPAAPAATDDTPPPPPEEPEEPKPHRGHLEVFKGKDAQFYFRVIAGNGEELAVSEGHKRRKDAEASAHEIADGDGLEVRIVKA